MKNRNLIALAGIAALLCSCIPSVNPFYTAKDIVSDPRLLGVWQEINGQDQLEAWQFESTTNKIYKLTVTDDKGKQGQFDARLFKLKRNYFLDLIPSDCNYATNQADLVGFAMFPGHLLVHVSQFEPKLKLAFFDFDWLQKHLEKNPEALAHHQEDDRILLTAGTRELQRFILKHLGDGELFEKPSILDRQTNNVSALPESISNQSHQ